MTIERMIAGALPTGLAGKRSDFRVSFFMP